MYEIFKNVLKGQYELVDMLNKIAEYYIKGNLSKEEKEELEEEARTNANPENSYAPIMEQLNEAFKRIEALESDVKELKGESTDEPIEPVEEYPQYVQPTGAHDAYHIGDKILTTVRNTNVSLMDAYGILMNIHKDGKRLSKCLY